MTKKTFTFSWPDYLGKNWLNIWNLQACLFSRVHIGEKLVTIKEVKPKKKKK